MGQYQSTYRQILESVRDGVVALDLTGLDDYRVKILKVFNERSVSVQLSLPAVLIFPLGTEDMSPSGGTICRDDIGYPVAVAMLDAERQDTATGLPVEAEAGAPDQDYNFDNKLVWREQIRKKFFHQRLDGVQSVYTCYVEPLPIVDPVAWVEDYPGMWIGTLLLRFMSRESRTTIVEAECTL